jgi:hypothetical protein
MLSDPFIIARFLSHVDAIEDGKCWEWSGITNSNGYGRFSFKDVHRLAHRVSFEIFFGPIPQGMNVCHRCDNRLCVNPEHLWLGTQSENLRDAVSKGRLSQPDTAAEKNGNRRLDWEKVQAIRDMHRSGVKKYHIAGLFGVSPSTIANITNFETWKAPQ